MTFRGHGPIITPGTSTRKAIDDHLPARLGDKLPKLGAFSLRVPRRYPLSSLCGDCQLFCPLGLVPLRHALRLHGQMSAGMVRRSELFPNG